MSTTQPNGEPTESQRKGVEQLVELLDATEGMEVVGEPSMEQGGYACVIELDTTGLDRACDGLKVNAREQVTLTFTDSYPHVPPEATVDHLRWLGFPHVMAGQQLCLFLDHFREWDPDGGAAAVLHRLWDWFAEAAAGRFDPRTSLHHGFGGVTTASRGNPMLVVRSAPDDLRPGIRSIAVAERSPRRMDLISWSPRRTEDHLPGLALVSAQPFRLGLPTTLRGILHALVSPVYGGWDLDYPTAGFPTVDLLRFRLEKLLAELDPDEALVLLFAAPNLGVAGSGGFDLMAARTTAGALAEDLDASSNGSGQLDFMRVDDARPEVTTRRDDARPTSWFHGRSVELWGCGALGSWIAELLVRSGVRRLHLRDFTNVTSGLLVRQNFLDEDIGTPKAEALASRLRGISPDVEIKALGVAHEMFSDGLDDACELLIDATVSGPAARLLDFVAPRVDPDLLIAQVATDSTSATLGLVTCTHGGTIPSELDATVRDTVLGDPQLQAFRRLWDGDDELLTPARGCSTPTFRGSAADVMGVASSLLSLLGGLCRGRQIGAQLIRLPHSPMSAPDRTWVQGPAVTSALV
ncbi:MAG TPA: ThiF family adenylyltransferase [Microthrixaceae bacterium]|nr:ThiF family adenylyltransferase [Microthrixaceae bacterium]